MLNFPHRVLRQFCAEMAPLHRTTKIAPMGCIDLIALTLCFLAAMLLRGGDVKLAAHYVPASDLIVALAMISAFSMPDLYRAVIRFIDGRLSASGRKTPQNPDGGIEMKFAGLFPGEKLHEELLADATVFPSEHPRRMRMKENALRPSVLETCITCRMMACKTHERGMIESMVKAIVSEYTPQLPVAAPAQQPELEPESGKARLSLIHKAVPFRI